MKTSAFIIACLMGASTLACADTVTLGGDVPAAEMAAVLMQRKEVENKLSQSLWTLKGNSRNTKTTFYFDNHGTVDITSVQADGHASIRTKLWHVETEGTNLLLVLSDLKTRIPEIYYIRKDGRHFILTEDYTEMERELVMSVPMPDEDLDLMRADLTGKWKMNCSGNTGNSNVKVSFLADGTYRITTSLLNIKTEETGLWDITRDGQYLRLRSDKGQTLTHISRLDYQTMKLDLSSGGEKNLPGCTQGNTSFQKIKGGETL